MYPALEEGGNKHLRNLSKTVTTPQQRGQGEGVGGGASVAGPYHHCWGLGFISRAELCLLVLSSLSKAPSGCRV